MTGFAAAQAQQQSTMPNWYLGGGTGGTGSAIVTNAANAFYITTATTATNTTQNVIVQTAAYNQAQAVSQYYVPVEVPAPTKLERGVTYNMPDGSKVIVDHDGSYRIDDKDAKVIYRAAHVRNFNPFLNASDLLEQYISELIPQGIRQDEVLHLEIEHFIYWLVCKAAERDNDPLPGDFPKIQDLRAQVQRDRSPRCGYCGQYIRRAFAAAAIYFCSPVHMEKKLMRLPA